MKLTLHNATANTAWAYVENPALIQVVRMPANTTLQIEMPPGASIPITWYDDAYIQLSTETQNLTNAAGGGIDYVQLYYDTTVAEHLQNFYQINSYEVIATTLEVPVIGEVTLPDWALVSPEMAVFFAGFATASGIALFRAGLRWWKRADGSQGEN